MHGIMQARADMHVWEPRKVAIERVSWNVIDGQRPLVRCECPAAGGRILGNLTSVVRRVLVESPNWIDRGKLVELQGAVAHGINAICHAREQLRVEGAPLAERPFIHRS